MPEPAASSQRHSPASLGIRSALLEGDPGLAYADQDMLEETLAASVLVNDPEILAVLLDWHRARHDAHQDALATDDLVELLASGLPATPPRVAALVTGT